MIRDEEANLPRCLASVKPFVDEIIVIDTGSADNSRAVAENYGARVYDLEWTGDFSRPRNFALEKAAGEWVLYLDADEELIVPAGQDLLPLLNNREAEGYFLEIISFLGAQPGGEKTSDLVVRLFRNRSAYRFTGAIHEQITPSVYAANPKAVLLRCPLKVYHYGYLEGAVKSKNKITRNLEIINKALTLNPQAAFLYFSLGSEYLLAGDHTRAIEAFTRCIQFLKGNEGYLSDVYYKLALCLAANGQYREALPVLTRGLTVSPGSADLLYLQGLVCLELKNYRGAAAALSQSLPRGKGSLPVPGARYRVYRALGRAWEGLGRQQQAVSAYLQGYLANPRCLYSLNRAASLVAEAVTNPGETRVELLRKLLGLYLKGLQAVEKLCLQFPRANLGQERAASLRQLTVRISKELNLVSEAENCWHDED